ncbi:hypothetical protein Q3G72_002929 [Acer saccharum]|nr:hypothetical protein Q3G72_002929 [Acer saccharum]
MLWTLPWAGWMVLGFAASFVLSLHLTPRVRQAALRFGVVDAPKGPLKTHTAPVAYLGGIAIYLSYILTLCLVFSLDAQLLGMLLGGTLMLMLGLFDDLRVLPPSLKLAGQLLATLVLCRAGIFIKLAFLPVPIALTMTVLWVVGITNALNILDVCDGLAASSAAIAAMGLAAMCALNGNMALALTALALAGALWGFVPANWAPASIYLGDAGSLFIGTSLAALSLVAQYTQKSAWGALAPVAFLVTPLLDICLVCAARLSQGKNPLLGSPDHFALRLKAAGWRTQEVSLFGVGLSTSGAVFALLLSQADAFWAPRLVALGAGVFVALGVWLWRKPAPLGGGAQLSARGES